MKWTGTRFELPEESGKYVVSIKRQLPMGIVFSNHSAYYDADKRRWFKYDPFDDNYIPKEDITENIAGWIKDMVSYFG